ncbi:5-methyltetrahydropteroyltriglutamate--homocysteine S-methyltransferase [Natribacillus halophilus]|uniref:5-methyltetrahydropteroyltriglutamate--homocysteine methyltransferase n=1 Tax=Natribacillus halophilus TaxID=549003 RepID=A0A1G8KZH3_9BACI|nr:5-methyltetrahydropteroyltriglutamate--homocysteine S-methyltransferase [Natribacillus halophilus]SDI48824.1 methionine synthase (B12-independent) [Natribacillus halophilus]
MNTSLLGYPRIGEKREWKKALEDHWAGNLSAEDLHAEMKKIRLNHLKKQQDAGIEYIPVGDFTYYDHILDAATMFGFIPERFTYEGGKVPLDTYFAMARGNKDVHASEMTKWYNTNYHYIVPEIGNTTPSLKENYLLEAYKEAREELGIEGKPVVIGPYSFLKLAKHYESEAFPELLEQLTNVYTQLFTELADAGVQWVQVDEPSLVTTIPEEDLTLVAKAYETLQKEVPQLNLLLQTYFDAVSHYEKVIQLPVAGFGLDFVHDQGKNLHALQTHGFPEDKVLAAGIIDGRNIWKAKLRDKRVLLQEIQIVVDEDNVWLQPSASLLHTPVTVENEPDLDETLKRALSFADEKMEELITLHNLAAGESEANAKILEDNEQIFADLKTKGWRKEEPDNSAFQEVSRPLSYEERREKQLEKWPLPTLPTTTIGSFPQTRDVRRLRARYKKGELSQEEYQSAIQSHIRTWIEHQEDIGLDVLVHGEFERNDMVEFFGERLEGFAFTKHAWVQSYGSRGVKPPIIYGDVRFKEPMTVEETVYAQSLTDKPVKGMLTGPVTILNWSFERDDLPKQQVAFQIAEAIKEEVSALEEAGIEMIQIDEPALREGLPLKREDWQTYLDWAVHAFRLSSSHVKNTTQIHTHMCYSEFQDIITTISALDADVISIETSRSQGDILETFEDNVYDKGIGLGVYDIHSPRVPSEDEMLHILHRALNVLPADLFWVNPDCGLKTRGEEETIAALKKMVNAAQKARAEITG